jgi:hypothetical protein
MKTSGAVSSGLTVCIVASLLVVLCACAVTRIDVDVYKGPLTNEKSIQMDRLAVMATGVRPLLLDVRNRFECRARKVDSLSFADSCVEDSKLVDSNAKQVNAVISLYENRTDEVPALLAAARRALTDYAKAYEILRPAESSSVIARRAQLFDALDWKPERRSVKDLNAIVEGLRSGQEQNLDPALFRDLYWEMLNPQWTKSGDVVYYEGPLLAMRSKREDLRKKLKSPDAHALLAQPFWMESLSSDKTPDAANRDFALLENRQEALADAKIVLKSTASQETQDRFADEVVEVAKAFSDSRAALDRLLDAVLQLAVINGEREAKACGDNRLTHDQHRELSHLLADYAALLIRHQSLRVALDAKLPASCANDRSVKNVRDLLLAWMKSATDQDWNKAFEDHDGIDRFLRCNLTQDPRGFGADLLAIHRAAKCSVEKAVRRDGTQELAHGLGRGPTIAPPGTKASSPSNGSNDVLSFDEHAMRLHRIASHEGLLAQGRLDDGLFTTIEKYLTAKEQAARGVNEPEIEHRLLIDELARFAEKVLAIANNTILLSQSVQGEDRQFEELLRERSAILQAVGNAILVQANEIRESDQFASRQKDSADREANAIRSATPTPGKPAFDHVCEVAAEQQKLLVARVKAGRDEAANLVKDLAALEKAIAEHQGSLDKDAAKSPCPKCGSAARKLVSPYADCEDCYSNRAVEWLSAERDELATFATEQRKDRDAKVAAAAVIENELANDAKRARLSKQAQGGVEGLAALAVALRTQGNSMASKLFELAQAPAAKAVLEELQADRDALRAKVAELNNLVTGIDTAPPSDTPARDVIAALKTTIEDLSERSGSLDAQAVELTKPDPSPDAIRKAIEALNTTRDRLAERAKSLESTVQAIAGSTPPLTDAQITTRKMEATKLRDASEKSIAHAQLAQDRAKRLDTLVRELVDQASKVARQRVVARELQQDTPTLTRLDDAIKLLDYLKAAGAGVWSANVTPPDVVAQIIAHPGPAELAGQRLVDARAEIGRLPVNRFPAQTLRSSYTKGTDPLDQLIASLEQEYIERVRREGKDSERSVNVRQAIDAAYAHRSGLVYIRPPAAFLKSSYPVTSLQRNSGGAWENMLAGHALRSVPIVDHAAADGNARNVHTNAEIDKQFWQNINTVRVAGGGNTNYVMVKDDIGNWYVKNFSGDPEPIIKGAKAMALFSLGPSLGNTNLIARERATAARAAGKSAQSQGPDVAAFDRSVGIFHETYAADAKKDAKNLDKQLAGLAGRLSEGFKKTPLGEDDKKQLLAAVDSGSVRDALARARDAADKAAAEKTEGTVAGGYIAEALGDLTTIRKTLLKAVANLPQPSRTSLDAAQDKLKVSQGVLVAAEDEATAAKVDLARKQASEEQSSAAWVANNTPATTEAHQRAVADRDAARKAKEAADAMVVSDKQIVETDRQAVVKQQSDYDKALGAIKAASQVVQVQLTDLISTYAKRRSDAAATYETELSVILKSAQQ